MKICLLASEFYPSYGGVGRTFTFMCKAFKDVNEKLFIFNSSYRGKNIFDILDSFPDYNLKDLLLLLKNRTHFYYFLISIWKIITAKQIKFYSRLNMLLLLINRPKILIKLIKNLTSVYPMLKKIKPDLIYGSSCGNTELPLGFVLSRLLKKKFICSAHGTDFLVRYHYSFKTHYLKALDKIIVHSDRLKDLIKKINHLDDKQLEIIPPGLYLPNYDINQEKDQIRQELNIQADDFVLISVGRHVPRKNFQIVIEAVKQIKKKLPKSQIKYFLIGKGEETQKLKNLVKNYHLQSEVIFPGAVNDNMKNKYLKASDVFIMPSISLSISIEGFGLVYLEANIYKLPVIGTITGGISEAIEHGKSGLLIKPNDLGGLIDAITHLYDHSEERIRMGEYGYKRVLNNYDWESIKKVYVKLFQELI